MAETVTCTWCAQEHAADFLCEAAAALLAKFKERGGQYNVLTKEFILPALDDTIVDGSHLCMAIKAKALVAGTFGIPRPGVLIQPVLLDGTEPTPYLYIDEDAQVKRLGRLVHDMADMAVRNAKRERDPRTATQDWSR